MFSTAGKAAIQVRLTKASQGALGATLLSLSQSSPHSYTVGTETHGGVQQIVLVKGLAKYHLVRKTYKIRGFQGLYYQHPF